MVRGPSNSRAGSNGSRNMATMAASPIQGTGCDISASLLRGNALGDAFTAHLAATGQARRTGPGSTGQPPGQAKDEVDLGQDEDDRQKDHGEAGQGQEQFAERCLECIHRGRPLELESDTGRGRPRLLAACSRVVGRERWHGCRPHSISASPGCKLQSVLPIPVVVEWENRLRYARPTSLAQANGLTCPKGYSSDSLASAGSSPSLRASRIPGD